MFRQLGSLIGRASDSTQQRAITVLISAFAFGALEFALHMGLARLGVPALMDAAVAAGLCGLTFGLLLWLFLAAIRERRRRVKEELDRISEVNHEIRNALQIITHSHFNAEPQHRDMVLDSVTRIDAVLKRIFPTIGR
jgi:two-component sensor histidine kinase